MPSMAHRAASKAQDRMHGPLAVKPGDVLLFGVNKGVMKTYPVRLQSVDFLAGGKHMPERYRLTGVPLFHPRLEPEQVIESVSALTFGVEIRCVTIEREYRLTHLDSLSGEAVLVCDKGGAAPDLGIMDTVDMDSIIPAVWIPGNRIRGVDLDDPVSVLCHILESQPRADLIVTVSQVDAVLPMFARERMAAHAELTRVEAASHQRPEDKMLQWQGITRVEIRPWQSTRVKADPKHPYARATWRGPGLNCR